MLNYTRHENIQRSLVVCQDSVVSLSTSRLWCEGLYLEESRIFILEYENSIFYKKLYTHKIIPC